MTKDQYSAMMAYNNSKLYNVITAKVNFIMIINNNTQLIYGQIFIFTFNLSFIHFQFKVTIPAFT